MTPRQLLLVALSVGAVVLLALVFAFPPLLPFTGTALALTVLGIVATVLTNPRGA